MLLDSFMPNVLSLTLLLGAERYNHFGITCELGSKIALLHCSSASSSLQLD